MIASQSELFAVLRQYNPWWASNAVPDLPPWRRAAFQELSQWLLEPPARRAVLLSGARQIGKTTLLLQCVQELLTKGIPAEQILYVTFDHPLMKLIGIDGVMKVWRETRPDKGGAEYFFLDEIQYTKDWQTWLKLQVDFEKKRRIVVTGSAIPLGVERVESGVGRWHTIQLSTLSFYEYLQIKKIDLPRLPALRSLAELFQWSQSDRIKTGESARPLVPHFHEYLLRGGFPQTALVESIPLAQKLLREDIVDKVLKRDMTALFGVRRVLELERTFLYLCLHDGGILDVQELCNNLGVKKPTVNNFIHLLESSHLIYRLLPFGYGKEVLRGRYKVYLADAAIAGSVLLKGKSLLEDNARLGAAVETAFFKHLFTRYYQRSIGFSYWRGKKDFEVDVVADMGGALVPFEVKYREPAVTLGDIKGLRRLCQAKAIARAYVITRDLADFGIIDEAGSGGASDGRILKVPAALACYWLSETEFRDAQV